MLYLDFGKANNGCRAAVMPNMFFPFQQLLKLIQTAGGGN